MVFDVCIYPNNLKIRRKWKVIWQMMMNRYSIYLWFMHPPPLPHALVAPTRIWNLWEGVGGVKLTSNTVSTPLVCQ